MALHDVTLPWPPNPDRSPVQPWPDPWQGERNQFRAMLEAERRRRRAEMRVAVACILLALVVVVIWIAANV